MNLTRCTLNFYPTETLHYRQINMTPQKYPVYHTMILLKYHNADMHVALQKYCVAHKCDPTGI